VPRGNTGHHSRARGHSAYRPIRWERAIPRLHISSSLGGTIGIRSDLHSGLYGGNVAQSIARLAASFHTPVGRVAVAGFYERVRELSPAERAEIAAVPLDEEEFRISLNAPRLWGEPGYSVHERGWARPAIDINEIWGGFSGEGVKTVTPCAAHPKLTCPPGARSEARHDP
jgi:hypothetical protein